MQPDGRWPLKLPFRDQPGYALIVTKPFPRSNVSREQQCFIFHNDEAKTFAPACNIRRGRERLSCA